MMRLIAPLCLALMIATPALAGPVSLRVNPVDDDGRVTLGDVFENAGAAANIAIATRSGPSVVFEAGQLQAQAMRAGLQWANPQGLRRVVVREGGTAPADVASGTASAALSPTSSGGSAARPAPGATVPVLAYARNLTAGDVIQPQDVVWSTVQAQMVPSGAPQDPDQVVGLSARRALRAGAPIGQRDLASPQVIARNDMVEVAFVSGGVKLTVTGRAQRAAAVGEPLSVLNLQSNRTIDAVATGPGRAVAGPAAETARASVSQFAAR